MEETEWKQTVCRKTDMIREVLWSELVADVLGDIIGRLCVADRIRFRVVCKSWRDAKPVNTIASTSTSTLSWFVSVGSTNENPTRALECRLFDPSYSVDEPVSVHKISFTKLRIPFLFWARIRTFCKQGWLFISITEITGLCEYREHFILFYPLTRKLKQLPSIISSSNYRQTFSSDPESADCVFLLLHTWSSGEFFTVRTCRKDDTEWTVKKFKELPNLGFRYSGPLYTRGLFYIVSLYGQLASYNVIEEKMKYETLHEDGDFAGLHRHRRYKVFTRNGELMYNYRCNGTKRFDWSKKVWIPVSSLTDPPAASDKVTRVEDMIEILDSECFLDSECLCSSECSSLADHLMFKPQKYVFDSGRIKHIQKYSNSFFWLEPPLLH